MGGIGSGAKRNEEKFYKLVEMLTESAKTIEFLASQLETSERTIYRHIQKISETTPVAKYLLRGRILFKIVPETEIGTDWDTV